ncbi:hypothetical protein Tsubulata_010388 [Turnera subulata]|uniref:Gfo/Idh/MocA-like oxidoreductase N-terminal domain-containing protein n=1 Tax=Turnera subulata TaxID=218843 RepID=A0A9Q0FZP9_9ROSI|nr:hypothetical protein Tsubulata_010388 [Turnera subulata]
MGENPVRFGILACANIARKVARAIQLAPNSTLYAIASRSLEKAKQFATANGFPSTTKVYGSYEELLDDPGVDVLYMPLPTSLHVQWATLAAQKRKHILLEKPTALDVAELDKILEACEANGVQFMDGSMWLHHPRTSRMKELLADSTGEVSFIHSTSTVNEPPEFFDKDIRVNPGLDALGALGDLGWYCIGAALWAKDYQLPNAVTALPGVKQSSAGVILSCTAALQYDQHHKTVAIIHCSFFSHSSMDLAVVGKNASFHLNDFIIPFQEDSAFFDFTRLAKFAELHIGWNVKPEKVVVPNELPQEALMVQELARLVQGIRKAEHRPDTKWPEKSRKTQMVVDAVKKSIDLGCVPIYL